jgi:diguanylate cyclase (GGDEF)-like protein
MISRLVLDDVRQKLDVLTIDATSGVYSKDAGTEQGRRMINRFNSGQRPDDKHKSAVLLKFDAEKFKQINETFGHPEGDRRIALIGSYLKSKARTEDGDLVWRNGGDEFVWLAVFDKRDQEAVEVLAGIEARLTDNDDDRHPDMPNLSWNHAFYLPGDALEDLMEKADNKGSAKAIARSQSKSAQENRQALMMALSY